MYNKAPLLMYPQNIPETVFGWARRGEVFRISVKIQQLLPNYLYFFFKPATFFDFLYLIF